MLVYYYEVVLFSLNFALCCRVCKFDQCYVSTQMFLTASYCT